MYNDQQIVEARNRVFDSTTLSWEAMAQPATISGGGSTQVAVSTGAVRVYQSSIADLLASVQQNSTVWNVQIPTTQSVQAKNSTIGDLLASVQQNSTVWETQISGRVRAQNSTAADLQAVVAQASTVWNVQIPTTQSIQAKNSTIGDLLASVQQNSTVWNVQLPTTQSFQVKNSTIGDLLASVQQNSTVWQTQSIIRDSSGTAYPGITTRPTTGVMALPSRLVLNDLQSTCFSSIGNNATSATVVSSVAVLRHKVFAYSITSTVEAVNTLTFASSLANPIWHLQSRSLSSGLWGANVAVTPPSWLFATEAASPLVFKITGTTGTYHLSFSYFSEA